jgi:hypothetical protein
MSSSIETYTGVRFDPFDPDNIRLLDIAHALSNICRFTGHSNRFYSVAQHSLFVADLVEPKYKREALMHDAQEAYINDLSTPVKSRLPEYRIMEKRLAEEIIKIFGITTGVPDGTWSDRVKWADGVALVVEAVELGFKWPWRESDLTKAYIGTARAVYKGKAVDYWPTPWDRMTPEQAKSQWLYAWMEADEYDPGVGRTHGQTGRQNQDPAQNRKIQQGQDLH